MENKTKTRIIFLLIFAFLASIDMVSTYLALSNGYQEGNSVGAILLNYGDIGYLYFFLYLMVTACLLMLAIEFTFWMNNGATGIKLPKWTHSMVFISLSMFCSVAQIMAIVNNLGMAI